MLCYYFRESCEKRKSCKLQENLQCYPFKLWGGSRFFGLAVFLHAKAPLKAGLEGS